MSSGITWPLTHRPRKRHTKLILLTVWILGLLFASPLVLFYTFDMVDQDNVKTPFCSLSSDPTYQLWYYVYNSVRQSLTH